jgi:hypothetical protein
MDAMAALEARVKKLELDNRRLWNAIQYLNGENSALALTVQVHLDAVEIIKQRTEKVEKSSTALLVAATMVGEVFGGRLRNAFRFSAWGRAPYRQGFRAVARSLKPRLDRTVQRIDAEHVERQ